MRFLLAACTAVLATTAPAFAAPPTSQNSPPSAASPAPVAAAAPAAASVPVDAARVAAARQTVDFVFPLGTYARIMNGTMDKMMDSIMGSMMDMPVKDLAGLGGVDASSLGTGTMTQIMDIYDPAYKERMRITTRTMMAEMMTLMTRFEPDIRDGLVSAYAARYETRQLNDLNRFFATPTGKLYAADSYMIMMSPEVMAKMQAFVPQLMQAMPAIVDKVKASTASLPPMRKYADLSEAEKNKLATLLGIPVKELDEKEAASAATTTADTE